MTMWIDSVQRILNNAVEFQQAAGISALIQVGGDTPVWVGAGYADLQTRRPVTRDSIFRLYSQTKPITAAAAMLLMQRGVIDLGEPVSHYLPGFVGQRVFTPHGLDPVEREVTLYDLLNMTAGLSYPGGDPAGVCAAKVFDDNQRAMDRGEPGLSTVEFANALGRLPLAFQPGREFRYSTCADVMGAVIEAASGLTFRDFLRRELLDPLGMADTDFYVPEDKRGRLVTCYTRTADGLRPWTGTHLNCGRYDRLPAFASGGAGLVSTLDDYLRFARMLLNRGTLDGREFLAPATVRYMTAPQLNDRQLATMWDSLTGYSYGRFMRIGVAPGLGKSILCPGEYGWDGWLGTYFANFPRERLTLLVMENTTDTGTSTAVRKVRNAVLAAVCGDRHA